MVKWLTAAGSFSLACYAAQLKYFPSGLQLADAPILLVASIVIVWTVIAPAAIGVLSFLLISTVTIPLLPNSVRSSSFAKGVHRASVAYHVPLSFLLAFALASVTLSVSVDHVDEFIVLALSSMFFVSPWIILLVVSESQQATHASSLDVTPAETPKPAQPVQSMRAYAITVLVVSAMAHYPLALPLFHNGLKRAGISHQRVSIALNDQYACLLQQQLTNTEPVTTSFLLTKGAECPSSTSFVILGCIDILWTGFGSEALIAVSGERRAFLSVPRNQMTRVNAQERCLTPRSS